MSRFPEFRQREMEQFLQAFSRPVQNINKTRSTLITTGLAGFLCGRGDRT